ncbi:MucBP domain-containing protein, partial [Ligilactobacillus faecis]
PTPQYPNDPTDPSKTVPNQPVPEIPGYRPEVPTVTPDKPGENTPVIYVPVVEDKYSLTERFVDEEGNELSASVTKGTDYKEGTEYDVTGDAKVINGYYLIKTSDNAKGKFGKDNVTVTFTYAKLGKIIPVDPNGKPIPDAPTPQYPNDPTDPSKTVPNQPVPEIPGYRPEVPTVTPDKPGENTPVIYVPVVEDKYSLTERFVDEEGNELSASVTKGTDYKEGTEYDVTGDAKVINGYYLIKTSDNAKGTFGKDNVTVTFTYAKLGKIVPVDPNGNPIPNVPTPQYPNDPTDPSKTVPNQPVPEIPGYRPVVPTVTPDKPGEDTPVIYVPVTPEKPGTPENPGAPEKPENQGTSEKPGTPEAPKATPVNNVQTPVKEPAKSPVASEGETKANELPQTGDEQNNALAAVGASIIAGLLGIIGFAKKKDDEKEN